MNNVMRYLTSVINSWRGRYQEAVSRQVVSELKDAEVPLEREWKVCEMLLEQIDQKKFASGIPYRVSSIFSLRSRYPNLASFNQHLEGILFAVSEQRSVPHELLNFTPQTVAVSEWMIGSDQYHLGHADLVKFFSLCDTLTRHASELEAEEVGVGARNSRILRPLFASLRDTLTDLHGLQSAL